MIDDFADDTDFARKSQLLHQLYICGKHYMISAITSTQVYKQISPIVRKNMIHLFIYILRNYNDLEPRRIECGLLIKNHCYKYTVKIIVSFM